VKFLIIDDSPADRELTMRRLRREFQDAEFVEVGRPDELETILHHGTFDFVLTDYQLNWTDGLHVLQLLRRKHASVPVVMVTGTGSEEIAVEGLQSGLSNYVLKSHLDRLPQIILDVLEKRRLQHQYDDALQQLRTSEESYRELFEQGLTAVFVCTANGTIITCNSAFAHIFGYGSVQDARSHTMRELFSDVHAFPQLLDTLAHERRLEYHDMEMRTCDGRPVYIVGNMVTTFDEQGRVTKIRGYLFDNTEQRRLADQLQQAQKLESIGLLVSGIAHDFNNMLGGILGYTSRGLSRTPEAHPLHETLERIQDIATRAAKMTQQLLAFSCRQVLEPINVNLNTVVENMLRFIGKILADQIDIVFHPDPDLHTIHVDYTQIEQVIMNLCINARDAMPDGGTLTIETHNIMPGERIHRVHPELKDEQCVMISVRDTGTGMSEETRAKIFEPFFTTKDQGKGTGLGLSMVHGIVGQHNGKIDVESQVGVGTCFYIYFPATASIVSPQEDALLPTRKSGPLSTRSATGSHDSLDGQTRKERGTASKILVVEDDPDLRYLMQEVLDDSGYEVVSASDGVEGLQVFEQHRPDIALVVSDLMTPRMKGKELYDRIQSMNEGTKFLFVSGYQANQISQNFVLDKGFEFLPKPFDLDELVEKVRKILA
jgi:PAS domain S-box-containing protein